MKRATSLSTLVLIIGSCVLLWGQQVKKHALTTNTLATIAGTTGLQLLAANSQAQAQAIVGASGSGQMLFATSDPPASDPDDPDSGAVAFSTTGKQYVFTPGEGWSFFRARGAQPDTGYPVNFTRRTAAATVSGNGIGNEWFAPFWLVDGEGAYAVPPATNILGVSGTFASGEENWVATGSNTAVNDAGRLLVTYGSDQWGAQLALNTTGGTLTEAMDGNQFYRARLEAYAAGGNADVGIYHDQQSGVYSTIATAAATTAGALPTTNFVYEFHVRHHASGDSSKLTAMGMGAGESVSIDNVTVYRIAPFDCVAVRTNAFSGDVVVRAGIKRGVGYAGIIAMANRLARPDSYLCVVAPQQYESANSGLMLYKVISGTWTKITAISTVNAGWVSGTSPVVGLELEIIGTTYNVRINGYLLTTGTVPTELQSNTYHGMLSSGGTSRVVSWTMQTPTEAAAQESSIWWFGGSLSYASDAPPNHLTANIIAHQAGRRFVPMVGAQNGYRGYNHVLRQTIWESMNVPDPSFIFCDLSANHSTAAYDSDMYDGFIRRLRKHYPNAALLSFAFPQWTYSSGFQTNSMPERARITVNALPISNAHGIPLIRIDDMEFIEVAAGFYPVTAHYSGSDGVHPNTAGKLWRAGQMRPWITDAILRGVHSHPPVASVAEVFAGSSWWTNTANYRPAAGDTTATWSGTWTDESNVEFTYEYPLKNSVRYSQTEGSTVTITGTWRVFVIQYECSANNQASYSIDGGTSYNLTGTANAAYANALGSTGAGGIETSSGAHSLTITINAAPTAKFRILGWMTL